MMKRGCFSVCSAIYILAICIAIVEGRLYTAEWAVEITEGGEGRAHSIANKNGLRNLGKIGGLENVYHFNKSDGYTNKDYYDITKRLEEEHSVELVEQQYYEERHIKSISGPNLQDQDDERNISVRVEQAWLQNLSGCNVSVAVVDDEIDVYNDLLTNFAPNISFDFFGNDSNPGNAFDGDPNPMGVSKNGTTCSLIIASSANESCDLGIAHQSNFGGIQIFSRMETNTHETTDITEAKALSFQRDTIDIYTNCWGAPDNGSVVMGPRKFTNKTLFDGVNKGRRGKGSIFVWANGNGGENDDDCAADGYASSIYTISVGSIGVDGTPTYYDEPCSAKLTVAPEKIGCNMTYTGTSAAASTASGIIALALERSPSLTWRDVQYLIAYTANPNLTNCTDTQENGAGLLVSRQYGFGVMDAEAMVTRAKHWINVPPKTIHYPIPADTSGTANNNHNFSTTVNYNEEIAFLEHVIVKISVSADPRGAIEIKLRSPSGTDVILLQNRPNDKEPGKYDKWPFMSVMFWGEDPNGTWTLTISQNDSSPGVANITSVEFEFHGAYCKPEAVAMIPKNCHPDCERGCAAIGSEYCDSCKYLRNANTLECINDTKCPEGYDEKNDYCYNHASLSLAECISPLKNKTERICKGDFKDKCEQICTYTFHDNECSCEDGYQLDNNGRNCSDTDECRRGDHGCVDTCKNMDGGYNCTNSTEPVCKSGYRVALKKNSTQCNDIQECSIGNYTCKHICVELSGSYKCECSTGYALNSDNSTCSDVDECLSNTTHSCEQICNNTDGSYECTCNEGYALNPDGRTCTEFIPLVKCPRHIKGDDNISPPIQFPKFPVGCTNVTTVYVGTNGYFTFDGFTGFTPFSFDRGNGLSLVAPFFVDIDDPQKHGSIKYDVHDDSTFEVAKSINRIIREEKSINKEERDPSFSGERFLIANWEKVSPHKNTSINITFQGILATNFRKTFAVFTYMCNGDKFPANPAVGYVTDGMAFNHDAALKENAHEFICNTNEHYSRIVYDISVCEPQPDC